MSLSDPLREKLRHVPDRPGVYLMKDAEGELLYVGKAKSLRPRVRSYFSSTRHDSLKTRELVRRIADFETIVVDSEAEALILENNLIKENRPRFNINLKDDKTYPYVKVTLQEAFPRVFVTRRLTRDGARYFGPYTDVRRMRAALELVKKLYTVRSCHYDLPREAPARPCLDHHIGRCAAPCVALQPESEYRRMIDEIVEILDGRTAPVVERLSTAMREAAAEMRFERAAELRDALRHVEHLESRQKVVDVEGGDRDVVGLARDGAEACAIVLKVREGKLLGRETVFFSDLDGEPDAEVANVFATRYYVAQRERADDVVPPLILFPVDFADRALVEEMLREQAGRPVRVQVPKRGDKVRLVELAEQNARHLLEEQKLLARTASARAPDALYELQEVLELGVLPRRIACFDISHTQGTETVASAVVFENGAPAKGEYRRLKIRGEWGNDDFRSMHEAVTRYFRRALEEGRPLVDLVVIDGGKGQLSAARRALDELDLPHQPVVSLAKREEEIFRPGEQTPIRLPRRSVALRLLQRLRDEAHRFAVGYNRTLRTKRTIRSELGEIPGVGPSRQRLLLERFGSMRGVAAASAGEIAALPGFGSALAQTILDHLTRKAEPRAPTASQSRDQPTGRQG